MTAETPYQLARVGQQVQITIRMDYPGGVISVNSCYRSDGRGGKKLKTEAKLWRERLRDGIAWLLIAQSLKFAVWEQRVLVQIDGEYTDANHATDVDNLQKLTWDAIKVAIKVDDRHFQPTPGIVTYGVAIPAIVVTIRLMLA